MYDDIIFMYELMTVWGTICETVVSETDSGVVISFTDEKKQKEISADTDVVERIKISLQNMRLFLRMMNWNALIFLRDGIKNLSFLLVIKRKN